MALASLAGLVASVSGVVMALSPLLQARRVRIAHDSSEVSSGVFLVMRTNATIWLTYGLSNGNLVIVIPNLVALVTTTATLAVIRRNRPAPVAVAEPAPAVAALPVRHVARVRGGAASVVRAGRRMAFARR
jgi:hypothetical protein